MLLDPVINQLRQFTPQLKTVGGAADFNAGLESVVNPEDLPSAYVVPLADVASENSFMTGLNQMVEERISVVVEFDNAPDRRGQSAVSQVEAMKYAIFRSLLNWRNDTMRAVRGLQYAGGRLLGMDRGRLWWSYDFSCEVTIDDTDGFQVQAVDLIEIDVDVYIKDFPEQPVEPEPELPVIVKVHPPY